MSTTPARASIGLENFKYLSVPQTLRYARDLSRVRSTNPGLQRELPIAWEGYRTFGSSLLRVARIARTGQKHNVWAAIVSRAGNGIGVATAQIHRPEPDIVREGSVAEVSYWLDGRYEPAEAHELGVAVLKRLVALAPRGLGTIDGYWSVTLPDDDVKASVLAESGFIAREEPQPYDLSNRVAEPRQLWARGSSQQF